MTVVSPRFEQPCGFHRPSISLLRCWRIQGRWMLYTAVSIHAICICLFHGMNASSLATEAGAFEITGTAVVVDAGSTGSRLYVYSYTYAPRKSGEPQGHLQVDVPAIATKRISPGIAAFAEQVFMDANGGENAQEAPEEEKEPLKPEHGESAMSGEQFHSDAASSKTFAHYMQRLQRAALQALPNPEDQRRALVIFRGTAGMRALPQEQKQALLNAVCTNIQGWGLRYLPYKSCGVLSGDEEGALGWLALNQLLGRMPKEMSMVRLKQRQQFQEGGTGAMIEMGGASAQVVFELPLSALESSDPFAATVNTPQVETGSFLLSVKGHAHLKILRLCGKLILLFAKSYLGLGRQLALVRVAVQSLRNHYDLHASHLEEKGHPSFIAGSQANQATMLLPSSPHYEAPLSCFPQDVTLSIDLQNSHFVIDEFLPDGVDPVKTPPATRGQKCLLKDEDEARKGMSWEDLTSHLDSQAVEALAYEEAERLRNKRHTRARGVANFDGCQKDISSSWKEHEKLPFDLPKGMQLYGTENFFHFNEYVVQAEARPRFSISSFRRSAKFLCALPRIRDVLSKLHPSAAAEKAQTGCFGLVLMSQFLEDVLRLDEHRELFAVNEIDGNEVSWTTGILFVMLPDVLEKDQPTEVAGMSHDEL